MKRNARKWIAPILAVIGLSIVPAIALADGPAPQLPPAVVMQNMFDLHKDFACVKTLPNYTGVHDPDMDAFAQSKGLDAGLVNCYYFTWLFERDQHGTVTHYADRKGYGPYDWGALHWRDVNQVIANLSGTPAYKIDEANDRGTGWADYPRRYLGGQ